jgi:hypothetical protein
MLAAAATAAAACDGQQQRTSIFKSFSSRMFATCNMYTHAVDSGLVS